MHRSAVPYPAALLVILAVVLVALPASTWASTPTSSNSGHPAMGASDRSSHTPGLTYGVRLGLSGNFALASPKLYGLGTAAEATLIFRGRYAAGLRLDGIAMLGFGFDHDISVGARLFGASLAKFEVLTPTPAHFIPGVGTGETKLVLGAAVGTYRIAAVGGSVSREVAEQRHEGVHAFAVGGRTLGIAPQFGFQKRRIRISLISHLLFSRDHVDPVFGLELAGQLL